MAELSDKEAAELGLESAPAEISDDQARELGLESKAEPPSLGRAVGEGILEGGTYGHSGEIQGAIGAIGELGNKVARGVGLKDWTEQDESEDIFGPPSIAEAYRRERDAADKDREAAHAAHPKTYNVSQVLGAILAPGPKVGKTPASFAKAGLKTGALYGEGTSKADLTKGDLGEYVKLLGDTAAGAGVGAVTGYGAGLLNKPLQYGAQKLTEFGRRAYQRGIEKATKPIDSAIGSAASAVGGRVAAGRSTLSNLAEDAVNAELPENLRQRAAELLSDDMAKALNERVARSTQSQFFQRLPAIEKAHTALDEAIERGSPEARQAATDAFFSKWPMTKAIAKNVARIGLPMAGFTADKLLGGSGAVGGGLGLVTGQLSGRPLTLLMNAAKSPQFQRSAAQAGVRALEEAAPGAMEGLVAEQSGNPQSMTRQAILDAYAKLLGDEQK